MTGKYDPLMEALECIGSEQDKVKPCRMEMCPYFDTYDPYVDWPCDIVELARAARARIQALEKRKENKPE